METMSRDFQALMCEWHFLYNYAKSYWKNQLKRKHENENLLKQKNRHRGDIARPKSVPLRFFHALIKNHHFLCTGRCLPKDPINRILKVKYKKKRSKKTNIPTQKRFHFNVGTAIPRVCIQDQKLLLNIYRLCISLSDIEEKLHATSFTRV